MRQATLSATPPAPYNPPPSAFRLPPSTLRRLEPLLVALLLLPWSLAVRGYEGGRWWDVPVVKSFVDPSLYRNDPFVQALHDGTPAAYPYQLIALVVGALRPLPIDQALLALYLPATIAALALLYLIGLRLSGLRAAALLFVTLYVDGFRLNTIGTTILHSAEATPQALSLPFQLGGLYALLNGRLALAGVLTGLGFYLHTPSTIYFAAALGCYELVMLGRLGWRRVAISLGLLAGIGAPTILGSLLHHNDALPFWALVLTKAATASDISLVHHFSTRPLILYNLLGLTVTALALLAAPSDHGRRLTLVYFAVVGLMCLGALLFVDVSLRTPLSTLVSRLQLTRAAWLVCLLGLLFLARHLVVGWRDDSLPKPLILLLLAAMLTAPSDWNEIDPLLFAAWGLLILHALVRLPLVRQLARWAPWLLAAAGATGGAIHLELREFDFALSLQTAIVFAALALGWGMYERFRRQGISVQRAAPALALGFLVAAGLRQAEVRGYAERHKGGLRAAAEFQDWARTQTSKDSVFLILPGEPNNQDFYRHAERAHFLVRERSQWIIYFHSQAIEFERRTRALGVDQPARFREDLDPGFRRLTEQQVRDLARDYGVTHFVPARAGNFTFPIAYQSGGWTVYEVR